MKLNEILYLHQSIKKYETKELFELGLSRNEVVLNKAGHKVYYNNIIAFTELGYNIDVKYMNKEAYILFNNDMKIPIKKQDYFQYMFIQKLYSYSIKYNNSSGYRFLQKYFNDKYTNDEYYKMEDAFKLPYHKGGYRIDFLLHLEDKDIEGNQYWYIIEFFEAAHLKKTDPDFSIEKNRLNSLKCDNPNTNKEYGSIAIFWEKFLDDSVYFNNWIKHIIRTIKSFQNINNKEYWCIKELKKIVGQKELAKMIYNSSKKENIPCISLEALESLVLYNCDENEKNKLHKLFIANCNERSKYSKIFTSLITNDIDLTYDDGLDSMDYELDIITDEDIIYYEEKDMNQGYYLSNHGLYLYFSIINSNLVTTTRCITFLTDISKALVIAIEKQRDNILSMTRLNNIAYGLEDIYS